MTEKFRNRDERRAFIKENTNTVTVLAYFLPTRFQRTVNTTVHIF